MMKKLFGESNDIKINYTQLYKYLDINIKNLEFFLRIKKDIPKNMYNDYTGFCVLECETCLFAFDDPEDGLIHFNCEYPLKMDEVKLKKIIKILKLKSL